MPCLDDRAAQRIDATPAGDGLPRHQCFAFGHAAYDLAPVQSQDRAAAHGGAPVQRPVSAALMQSRVEPNHAWMPMIAGR